MVVTTTMGLALPPAASNPATMEAPSQPQPPSSADVQAQALAMRVARGEEASYEELYNLYHDRLLRLLIVLSRGDEGLAQDIVQLTMLTAASRLKPVKSEAHLWNWLARVARQHLLKQWRQRPHHLDLVGLTELPEVLDGRQSDALLEQSLDAALLRLAEDDRQLVEWFYFDSLTHKEMAERLGTSPKAVSSRLERVRLRLRELFERILSHET